MTDSNDTGAKPGVRWGRILLVGSLALNLLVVGMVAGSMFRGGGPGKPVARENPPLHDLGYGPYGRAFTKEDRQQISRSLAAHAPDLRQNREDFRTRSLALLDALRQTPYEPETVAALMAAQETKLQERQEIGKMLLLDHIAGMDDTARQKYADRLARNLRRGGKRSEPNR
ncbi:MAG: periplasmic heavy metal sensor [Paracoccaceae bacterium]